MSLPDWLANQWLLPHETSPAEIADLLQLADRGLADAGIESLSADARIGLAYSAALALAAAALAAAGYRAGRERHHQRMLDSLVYTLDLSETIVNRLHRYRRLRNSMTYERVGQAGPEEVTELLGLVHDLGTTTRLHLQGHHPELLERP